MQLFCVKFSFFKLFLTDLRFISFGDCSKSLIFDSLYDEYKMFKENFKNEKSSLMSRLEIVNKQINELEKSEYSFKEVGKLYEEYNSIKEVTKEIINEFVKKIIVGKYDHETNSREI